MQWKETQVGTGVWREECKSGLRDRQRQTRDRMWRTSDGIWACLGFRRQGDRKEEWVLDLFEDYHEG